MIGRVSISQGNGFGAFYIPFSAPARYRIVGVTVDQGGLPLGLCTVEVYETVPGEEPHGLLRGSTVSDANGNYTLDVTGGMGLTFKCIAYKPGSPDVFGTTVNTLTGLEI